MPHLFCFGMGFSANALARNLSRQGWQITGTSTRESGVRTIASAGWHGLLFDGSVASPDVAAALQEATHAIVSAPPAAAGDSVLACHRGDLARAAKLRWIGYLSTIGVYGDHGGAWIDETTPISPVSGRSRRRAAAESGWLQFGAESGKRVQVFRLAGIYGPGRSAIDNLRDGSAKRIVKPGQVFNRIHVDDIANVLEAAIGTNGEHAIYNVADDEPAPPQDVVEYAARLMGVAVPPAIAFETARLSEMAQSFYAENKRASNARVKADLGVTLNYPTYREGLRAILAGG